MIMESSTMDWAPLKEHKSVPLFDALRGAAPAGQGQGAWFAAGDGAHLFVQRWLPAHGAAPDRVVACLHGMISHGMYFGLTADAVCPDRGAVYSLDHRGHGLSHGASADIHSLRRTLADVREYVALARALHPGVPVFLLGQSMGALFAINTVARDSLGLAGLILEAPPVGTRFTPDPHQLLRMPYYVVRTLINPHDPVVSARRTPPFIFRNPAHAELDRADPFKRRAFPPHLMLRLQYMQRYAARRAPARLRLPLLVFQGGMDHTVDPAATRAFVDAVVSEDKILKFYPEAYHAMIADPECPDFHTAIRDWTRARIQQ